MVDEIQKLSGELFQDFHSPIIGDGHGWWVSTYVMQRCAWISTMRSETDYQP